MRHPVTAFGCLVIVAVYLFIETPARANAGAVTPDILETGQWWRLVTAMFLHGNVLHLAANVVGLAIVGSAAESRYGPAKYSAILLIGGIGGDAAAWLVPSPIPGAHTLGASGAVMAAGGALVTMLLRRQDEVLSFAFAFGTVIATVIYGFADPGISVPGHLGGLASGMLLGRVLGPRAGWQAPSPLERKSPQPPSSTLPFRQRFCRRLHDGALIAGSGKPGRRLGAWAPIWLILGGGATVALGLIFGGQLWGDIESAHRYPAAAQCPDNLAPADPEACYVDTTRTVQETRLTGRRSKQWQLVFDDGESPYAVTIPHPIPAFYSLCCHNEVIARIWDGRVALVEIPGQGAMATSDDPVERRNTDFAVAFGLVAFGGFALALGLTAALRGRMWLQAPAGYAGMNMRFVFSRAGLPFLVGSAAALALILAQVFHLDWTPTWIGGLAAGLVVGWGWWIGHDFDHEVARAER